MKTIHFESCAGQELYAYAMGYYYGRALGYHDNQFSENSWLSRLFKEGYDAGVADYCSETHADEVNV